MSGNDRNVLVNTRLRNLETESSCPHAGASNDWVDIDDPDSFVDYGSWLGVPDPNSAVTTELTEPLDTDAPTIDDEDFSADTSIRLSGITPVTSVGTDGNTYVIYPVTRIVIPIPAMTGPALTFVP